MLSILLAAKKQAGLLLALMTSLLLAGCNLNTTGGPNVNQTAISGPPTVQIAAPPPNGTFLESVPVNIQALIGNAGADIDRVEIVIDGVIAQTLKSPNTAGAVSFTIAQTWTSAGIGQHTIGVTAFRADGSSSAPAGVTVNVVQQGAQATATNTLAATAQGQNNSGQPTTTAQNTVPPPPPTNPPAPPPTATSSQPVATFNQGVNVRGGPSTKFAPPIGSFAAGQTANIIAKTPAGDWYKVQYYNGEGWVFGQLLTVSGDAARIIIDAGPPIPTDTPVIPTATPIIATPVPQSQVNLVAGNIRIEPANAPCFPPGQGSFNIFFDIANLGTQANTIGGSISVVDSFNGQQQASTTGAFPVIQPGQTVGVGPMPLTVSTNFLATHRLTLVIDSTNIIVETNEADNSRTLDYTLDKGQC